jgi:flavin-dependent dehydrogenase
MRIDSFCVVGGGSSGWMTAAALMRAFPEKQITLVEPSNRNIIGVGESTLGHINRFFRFLGLNDKDWMPYCSATYKSSIAFKNFRDGKGERFQYPFGRIDHSNYRSDYMTFFELRSMYPKDYPPEEFARFFNPNTIMAEEGKITSDYVCNEHPSWRFTEDTAYHMDSEKFGEYLDKYYCGDKIRRRYGKVESAVKHLDGSLRAVVLDDGTNVEADLFIDCTGFKSVILENVMGSEYISFNDVLFNDTAFAARVQYTDRENQMDLYTDCVALSSGWSWNIPLWDRVGTGYVFSKKHIDPDIAYEEFVEYLAKRYSPKVADAADYRLINIRHGKRKKAWVKNVVGIGLAYGFLEPLESTGLMTTHENILYLIDTIKRRDKITRIDVDSYNYTVDHAIEAMKNFIAMHYVLSGRDDNKYWQDCTNVDFAGKNDLHQIQQDPLSWHSMLQSRLEYYQLFDGLRKNFWSEDKFPGLIYIAAGQDFSPINEFNVREAHHLYPVRKSTIKDYHKQWQEERAAIYNAVEKLPTHYEYLRDYIYVEKD